MVRKTDHRRFLRRCLGLSEGTGTDHGAEHAEPAGEQPCTFRADEDEGAVPATGSDSRSPG